MLGHQEVEDVDVRPPGSRGCRCSFGHREVDEVVDQGVSSRVKTLPKNLIAPLSRAGSQRWRDFGGLLLPELCAVLAMGMQKATEGEGRGLLSRST